MSVLVLSLLVTSLWPHGAPGPRASLQPEVDTSTAADRQVAGRPVIRLGPVTEASMTLYPTVAKGSGSAPAVLVFPGGGYRILAYDLEGTEVCSWLNSIGITAVLVKYRVAPPGGAPQYAQPLQDAQRALALVRAHAKEWNIDPHQVGVLGFSAGGHLSALLSNRSEQRSYAAMDAADTESVRPDFVVLVYPAYLENVTAGSGTPTTFLVQAEDDSPFIDGTLSYYKTLKAAKIPSELHVYSSGGHGYGLRPTSDAVTGWPQLAEKFIRHALQ